MTCNPSESESNKSRGEFKVAAKSTVAYMTDNQAKCLYSSNHNLHYV